MVIYTVQIHIFRFLTSVVKKSSNTAHEISSLSFVSANIYVKFDEADIRMSSFAIP